jgi:hypothetical protein
MTESLINQTAEKINIKVNEKYIAYKRIYRLLAYFILCFSDGDRPYRLDSKLKTEYGTFNRYGMIRKDDAGNYFYVDWDVEIAAESPLAKSQGAVINSIMQMAQYGLLEASPRNVLAWTILARQRFPCADIILEMLKEQVKQIEQAQQQVALAEQQQIQQEGAGTQETQPATPPEVQQGNAPVSAGGNMDKLLAALPEEVRNEFLKLPQEEMAKILGG